MECYLSICLRTKLHGGRLMVHSPTPYLWGRGAGLRFGATGAYTEPPDKLAHRLRIHQFHRDVDGVE